jgi:hypothetical protein
MKPELAIAIPCHVFVAPQMAQSLAKLCAQYALVYEREPKVRFFGNAVSTFGRNALVRWAKSVDATHILWVDTDSVFPAYAADRLLASDIPFIGANFALKDGSGGSSAWGKDGRITPYLTGVEQVETIGMGLTLTRMDVVDAVGEPWFKMGDYQGGPADDYYFCQMAIQAGFPPHVDHGLSHECAHVGLYPFKLPSRDVNG